MAAPNMNMEHAMRTQRLIASALAALTLAASGAAFARPDDPGRHDDRGPYGQERRGGPRADDRRGPDGHGPGHGRGVARGNPHDHGHGHYQRGGRLPVEYRSRQYVVDDWRGHRLAAPPRGYHWVQAGGDYLLVAIATGIIAQVLLSR
jgi:Ni/Co efflux regulator RcnB